MEIDSELGMPIDLSLIPGIFEGDESALYAPRELEKLDPKDQALMKTTGDGQSAKLMTESAFLRRTQYISSEIATTSKAKQIEADRAKRIKDALKIELDPAEQLLAVEKTFDMAQRPLSELKHPAKRGLKAVESWTIMPNFDMYEQSYVNAKFPSNPAPKTKSNTVVNDEDARLEVACMVPRIVDDTIDTPDNDYISYFITDEDTAREMKMKNETPGSAGHVSRYKFVREYDAKKDDGSAEWAFVFNQGSAQYTELGSRMNMRGRRRGTQVTQTNEVIELTLRDLDEQELDERAKRAAMFSREQPIPETVAPGESEPENGEDLESAVANDDSQKMDTDE